MPFWIALVSPAMALLNHPLQLREAFEGNAEGEFNAGCLQRGDDIVAEESTVHADLNLGARQEGLDGIDAG